MKHQSIHLPNDPGRVLEVVNALVKDVGSWWSPLDREAITVSLVEVIMNAIEHGNLAIGYDRKRAALQDGTFEDLVETRRHMPPYASRQVTLDYGIEPRRAVFTIRDEGAGFDWHTVPDPRLDDHVSMLHGRGLLIVRAKMDECVFQQQGNVVTLVKYFTSGFCRCRTPERIGPCKLRAS